MFNSVDDVLSHYGVKGMKWGVRKDPKRNAEKNLRVKSEHHGTSGSGMSDQPGIPNPMMFPAVKDGKEGWEDINGNFYPGTVKQALESKKKYEKTFDYEVQQNIDSFLSGVTNTGKAIEEGIEQLSIAKEVANEEIAEKKKERQEKIKDATDMFKKDIDKLIEYMSHSGTPINKEVAEDVILAHFGVKGMKWGVRKDKKSSVKDLSDAELQKKVNRLNLEKRYADLKPESKNRAVEAVKKILIDVGTRGVKSAMNKKVDQLIEAKVAVKPKKDNK